MSLELIVFETFNLTVQIQLHKKMTELNKPPSIIDMTHMTKQEKVIVRLNVIIISCFCTMKFGITNMPHFLHKDS